MKEPCKHKRDTPRFNNICVETTSKWYGNRVDDGECSKCSLYDPGIVVDKSMKFSEEIADSIITNLRREGYKPLQLTYRNDPANDGIRYEVIVASQGKPTTIEQILEENKED